MPLLVIFQIPAAKHLPRYGYRRFVLAGWGTRVVFICGMALVPLTGGFLDPATQLALLLTLLFGFNLVRGISTCAWLPWMTALVPASLRGRYLVRDAACLNVGSFAVFVFAAFVVGAQPLYWEFSLLFAFSATMGAISLLFLRRIPNSTIPGDERTNRNPVPWREIAAFPPFRKLLRTTVAWAVAYGGLNTFVVAFLKTETALVDRDIMLVTSTAFLGGLSSLWFLGARLDRLGSRPVLMFSMAAWILIMTGWILLAGRVLPALLVTVVPLQFLMGLSASMVMMAKTRLAMAIIPEMGRHHFFALYSVIGSLTLGLTPIFWGLFIDLFRNVQVLWNGFEWNPYTLFFTAVNLVFVLVLALCQCLEEPAAASIEALLQDLFRETPLRIWMRIWPRN
jgi:MFS family permease